jgi:hypothetical protein
MATLQHVATYVWENYIEVGAYTHIFMVGVGAASQAVIHLINIMSGK